MKISEHYSADKVKSATILFDSNTQVYWVDFYKENKLLISIPYPEKSIHYVEDAAENYVLDILHLNPGVHNGTPA